jgi:hypothetical protein
MKNLVENSPSAFAQMIDKLRTKSEEEIKALQIKFFSSEPAEQWNEITASSNFDEITEDDIIKAIVEKRYGNKNA